MNSDQFEGKWHEVKGGLRSKWGKLTDDVVEQIDGKREKLIGEIQSRYGKSKEEARQEVEDYIDTL